jgi:hypothetical protein
MGKIHDEHVVCSRQLHGGGKPKFLSEHVVGHTSRFFYGGINASPDFNKMIVNYAISYNPPKVII